MVSVVYERIYIRFKGRVLGPLPHDKVLELVARGQITRDQEMSSDAVNWTKASEFTTFFPPVQSQQAVKATAVGDQAGKAAETIKETWYVNIEGQEADKAYDEETIKRMIAAGTIQKSTPLWNQQANEWQDAGKFRPQWFAQSDRQTAAVNQQASGDAGLQSIGQSLVAARPWLSFLSIASTILVVIVFLSALTGFFTVLIGNHTIALRITWVVALAGQLVAAIGWLFVCVKLIRYVGRLTAVKYRSGQAEVEAAVAAQSGLAAAMALVFSFWALVTLAGVLASVVAWRLTPPPVDEDLSLIVPSFVMPVVT